MSCHLGAINFECLPRNSHATVTNSPSPSSRLCLFFLALIKPDWQSLPRRRSDRAKETIEKKSLLDRFSTGQRTDAQSFCFVQHLLLVSLSPTFVRFLYDEYRILQISPTYHAIQRSGFLLHLWIQWRKKCIQGRKSIVKRFLQTYLYISFIYIYIFQRNSSKDSFSKVSFIFDSFEIIRLYLARKFELILFVFFSEQK